EARRGVVARGRGLRHDELGGLVGHRLGRPRARLAQEFRVPRDGRAVRDEVRPRDARTGHNNGALGRLFVFGDDIVVLVGVLSHRRCGLHDRAGTDSEQKAFDQPHDVQITYFDLPSQTFRPAYLEWLWNTLTGIQLQVP